MSLTPKQIKDALKKYGSGRKAAEALGVPRTTFQDAVVRMNAGQFGATTELVEKAQERKPSAGNVKRYIFSCAQDQTPVDAAFWNNLLAYAAYLDATIHVAGFTYTTKAAAISDYDERVRPYITRKRIDIADRLIFCGEVNINPTATKPLSGLETYTRNKWGVFPHPRIELRSVATIFTDPAKQIMTTGCLTKPNYLPRKTGVKAEFHHVIGALLVEVDDKGRVFCRHLIADDTGAFHDLDLYAADGRVEGPCKVRAITWGDIHAEMLDECVADASWRDPGSMQEVLRPDYQFVHDLSDFTARNHHNIKDPHWRFKMYRDGNESVEDGMRRVTSILNEIRRHDITTVIVESNHDLFLQKWLNTTDFKDDPVNARYYLKLQAALYEAMHQGRDRFSIFKFAVEEMQGKCEDVLWLRESTSFRLDNVEYALHGHRGANGAKGHINSFAKMGSKAVVAHTHSPAIYEGIWQAGTSSKLDLLYNAHGLSSWAHAHVISYVNGKRALITLQDGKWRA